MADPRTLRKRVAKPSEARQPRDRWIRLRVSPAELAKLKVVGGPGDFATNARQILLEWAHRQRTKVPSAADVRRLQLYLIIHRQAQLVREEQKVTPRDSLGALLQAIDQLGKVGEDENADPSLD